MDFTITLSKDDWDAVKGGWRCPALQIPGTRVQSIYVDGAAVDPKYYEVNNALCLIRWSSDARPKQASVHIHAEKALSTEELTLKWRKLAIVLPVAGSLATALITAIVAPLFKASSGVEVKSKTPFLKVFERSNDFLATGDSYQFPSLLKAAKREAWFVGTTFYITTDQYHDQLLAKLSEGVDLNFLVLSPNGQLTDNGIQFCDLPKNRSGPPARWQTHMFDLLCRAHGIEHRLTKPNHPWTNGQVERMNRTLKEATVRRYHYDSHHQLRQHIQIFLDAYNSPSVSRL
jgi:hypothetical protein